MSGTAYRASRKVPVAAAALAVWGALVLLFAISLTLTGSASPRQAIRFGGSFWALWLLFLPAVAWFSFRVPIERRKLVRNVTLHLLACFLVVSVNWAAFRVAERVVPRAQRPVPPGPPAAFGVLVGLRAALDVLVYGAIVGVCQAITQFRNSRERERRAVELEARLASAKLQALRMQLNPHFLFNTLNSIAALVYTDPRAADEMLGDLSELLRRSLEMEEQEVPLSAELDFVQAYLRIEQRRFGERLRLEQSVPDGLMNALVPALILQPLIENAIRHGIEPNRGPGLISIEARQEADWLHLMVRDNGKGFTGENRHGPHRSGIGLANTQARLRELYGPGQRFALAKAEPEGCRVDLHLPLRLSHCGDDLQAPRVRVSSRSLNEPVA